MNDTVMVGWEVVCPDGTCVIIRVLAVSCCRRASAFVEPHVTESKSS